MSPHGQGSISMLEELLPRWRGKAFVLCLLGFAATDFVITITLSAADATGAHHREPADARLARPSDDRDAGPPAGAGRDLPQRLQRGDHGWPSVWSRCIWPLNVIVVTMGLHRNLAATRRLIANWRASLFAQHGNPADDDGRHGGAPVPKLALGLSGFETGVAVMPLVRGDDTDTEAAPAGRIRNTKKLLTNAALIMSVLLMGSSFVTTMLIPPRGVPNRAGRPNGRALAYLAHA